MAAARFNRAVTVLSSATSTLFSSSDVAAGNSASGTSLHGVEITVVSGSCDIIVEPVSEGKARTIASTDVPNTWTVFAWNENRQITKVTAVSTPGTASSTITTAPIM